MRRIAFLSEHASPLALRGSVDAGGQNVYVDEVARHLARLGHEVDVFTRRDSPDLPPVLEWAAGVRIVHLEAGPATTLSKDDLWPHMPEFRDRLLEQLGHGRYDLIHGNFWMSGWVGAEARARLGLPLVQIFHATGLTKRREQGDADTSPPDRVAVEMEVIAAADRVIAQCPAEERELIEDYGAPPGKVVVIPSAVNTEVFHPVSQAVARTALGLPRDARIVVYVGRLLPRKDVRNVVRALALLESTETLLLVVGGETREPDPSRTPELAELQQLAESLGVRDRVIFFGKRQPDELALYYGAGDVAVSTPWYEPFGLTPLEGQACARPVIGSAVGGITYTIADGETGFLVPPRDPRALAARLQEVLSDAPLRERLGRAARRRVEREFTWETVAERTATLYAQVLPAPRARVPAGQEV